MKEVYRLNQHSIREGYHIVIVGRGPLKTLPTKKRKRRFCISCEKQIIDTK